MTGKNVKIAAKEGGEFDCYLALPAGGPAPAIIVAASVYGVDGDVRATLDELAAKGVMGVGPDLFWRGDKGPLGRDEDGARRAKERAQPRAQLIASGLQDIADTIAHVKSLPQCNGKVVIVGLCYGGPFAVLATARLGADAGISFHGTKVEDYIDEAKDVTVPLVFHWGDKDHALPPEALAKVRTATEGMKNVEILIFPGIEHGYTAPSAAAYDDASAKTSWARALEVVDALRDKVDA